MLPGQVQLSTSEPLPMPPQGHIPPIQCLLKGIIFCTGRGLHTCSEPPMEVHISESQFLSECLIQGRRQQGVIIIRGDAESRWPMLNR